MFFLPVSLALFLLLLILIPLFFVFAPAIAFAKMGLDPTFGYAFYLLCLLGGGINIPIRKEKTDDRIPEDDLAMLFHGHFGIRGPIRQQERVLSVNLGGAILPGLLSIYLVGLVSVLLA